MTPPMTDTLVASNGSDKWRGSWCMPDSRPFAAELVRRRRGASEDHRTASILSKNTLTSL